jgi:hypothetical protein
MRRTGRCLPSTSKILLLIWSTVRPSLAGETIIVDHRRLPRRGALQARHYRCVPRLVDRESTPSLRFFIADSQYYKVARGDDIIPIVGEWYQNATASVDIVSESHTFWWDLVKGHVDSNTINYNQTLHADFASYTEPSKTTATFKIPSQSKELAPVPKPSRFSDWYYLYAGVKLVEQK